MNTTMLPPATSDSPLRPNLCHRGLLLPLIALTEGFAVTICLVNYGVGEDFWAELALISLYMQWITISYSLFACLLTPAWRLLSPTLIYTGMLLLLPTTILLVTRIALLLLRDTPIPQLFALPDNLLWRSLVIGTIVGGFALRYFYIQQQWRSQTLAQASYRLQALQARIRPHFLFNTLNSLTTLVHTHPHKAEDALLDLADLFRHSLRGGEESATLQQELDLTRRYLAIESLRLGARLQIEWDIAEQTLQLATPPLIVQPLVENAIYHGIELLPTGGRVHIQSRLHEGGVQLIITNPCPPLGREPHRGAQMAVDNIRNRVEGLTPIAGSLTTYMDSELFTSTLWLPLRPVA